MKEVGWGTVILSGCILVYALSMTTTVSTGLGEVHNIGLLDRKQSLMMVAIAGLIIGTGLVVAQSFLDNQSPIGSTPLAHADGDPMIIQPGAHCGYCGAVVELPMEPCSAFSIEELQSSPDAIEGEECRAALTKANVFGIAPKFTGDGAVK